MALLNRFENIADEKAYLKAERLSRRTATRVLLAIVTLLYLVYAALNPSFFPDQDMTAYHITTGVMILILVTAFYLTGTKYYLEWRLFDVALFVASALAIAILTAIMANMKEDVGGTFRQMARANLNALYVYNSIIFVANFRYFFFSMLTLTAVYVGYMLIVAVPPFTIAAVIAYLAVYLSFALFVNWVIDEHAREVFATEKELNLERRKSESLLYRVLPKAVAKRLRAGEPVADSFANVSVIFVDIVDSSLLAKRLSPTQLVEELNHFFLLADKCADYHGVEKVKTIGDAYLAVAGGIASNGSGADAAVSFGRDLIAQMIRQSAERGRPIQLRIGIHSGPVVGGVVGSNRLAYDYWGDTMNVASRIQHAAEPDGLVVSAATREQCQMCSDFELEEMLSLKGIGDTKIHRLKVSA